jgi:hypothetical protein
METTTNNIILTTVKKTAKSNYQAKKGAIKRYYEANKEALNIDRKTKIKNKYDTDPIYKARKREMCLANYYRKKELLKSTLLIQTPLIV